MLHGDTSEVYSVVSIYHFYSFSPQKYENDGTILSEMILFARKTFKNRYV